MVHNKAFQISPSIWWVVSTALYLSHACLFFIMLTIKPDTTTDHWGFFGNEIQTTDRPGQTQLWSSAYWSQFFMIEFFVPCLHPSFSFDHHQHESQFLDIYCQSTQTNERFTLFCLIGLLFDDPQSHCLSKCQKTKKLKPPKKASDPNTVPRLAPLSSSTLTRKELIAHPWATYTSKQVWFSSLATKGLG